MKKYICELKYKNTQGIVSSMDLVGAIDYANEVGSSNVYWQWDQSKREEFKQYHSALHARTTAPPTEEDEDDATSECEPEVQSEPEQEQEQEPAEARTELQREAPEQPAARKKNSRWIEYTQIAREELKQSTGQAKVPQKEVFALARKYYVEDGWAK